VAKTSATLAAGFEKRRELFLPRCLSLALGIGANTSIAAWYTHCSCAGFRTKTWTAGRIACNHTFWVQNLLFGIIANGCLDLCCDFRLALAASYHPGLPCGAESSPWSSFAARIANVFRGTANLGLAGRRWSFLVPVSLFLIRVSQGQNFAFSTWCSRDLQADGQSCLGETAGN
jgi:hypothetical protein